MSIFKGILAFFAVILLLCGLAYGFGLFNIFYTNHIGVPTENANRNVMKQSQSWIDGKAQDVAKYRLEYIREKDPVAKEAIRQTVILSTSDVDVTLLPIDIQEFIRDMKSGSDMKYK